MNDTILAMQRVKPGSFSPVKHWYPRALNAQIHPMVAYFMNMSNQRIAERYSYRHPQVSASTLLEILSYKPTYFKWAGSDLMHATNHRGRDHMVVIETNSCPSGLKSFPLLNDAQEQGAYYTLLKEVFVPQIPKKNKGAVAVIFDKNPMENWGYASALADLLHEEILVIDLHEENPSIIEQIDDYVWIADGDQKIKLRAMFRYVTQKPWGILPPISKTVMFNPIVCCLAGGRNKLMAAKAYDFLNAELEGTGLQINAPETIWDARKNELPLWIERFDYRAVIKVPYGNAGQGIYTITSKKQFDEFMEREYHYQQFIVQQLIGHPLNIGSSDPSVLYQIGTVPNKNSEIYVFDVRMTVGSTNEGFRPVAANSRRAATPLALGPETPDMLMTNLSFKKEDGEWSTDESRLLMMDGRDFNKLGLGLDDLIDGYIQTVLAVRAIDNMAINLISSKRQFKKRLFQALNNDQELHNEIWPSPQ
jgi:hypothetical protein